MNILAHLFLSGDDESLLLGNFMGDFVKGKKYMDYPMSIQKGILLHRYIDTFTDTHPIAKQGIIRLRPEYSKFSGVIVDMFYDYLLATNWHKYHHQPYQEYVVSKYAVLEANQQILPDEAKYVLTYMVRQNWLARYVSLEGLALSLKGITRRSSSPYELDKAIENLQIHLTDYQNEFEMFFDELQEFVKSKF
jgi:acyl carrier protein phosphodiesterase